MDGTADRGCEPAAPCTLDELVRATGTPDLFVLRRVEHDRFMHIGGTGRGTGWAGIIDLVLGDEPRVAAALSSGHPLVLRSAEPARVFGPYYARGAVIIGASPDVVVVFGAPDGLPAEVDLGRTAACAAQAESLISEISPAKRLADELEVLHAVKAVMHTPSPELGDVAAHVVRTAAAALSCEVVLLHLADGDRLAVHDPDGRLGPDRGPLLRAIRELAARADLPTCQQEATAAPLPPPLSPADGVSSYFAIRLGERADRGLLLVCHTVQRARGFTSLCQELAGRLAEAADTVLHAAQLRAQLQRDLAAVQRDAQHDPLTGLANRRAFDAAAAAADQRRADGDRVGVVVVDLDGLKAANDAHGHDVGDRLIQAAGRLLESVAGSDGLVARLGGDEFAVLVDDAGRTASVVDRIVVALDTAAPVHGLSLTASVGMATTEGDADVREALRRADKAMYAAKLSAGRARPAGTPPLAATPG